MKDLYQRDFVRFVRRVGIEKTRKMLDALMKVDSLDESATNDEKQLDQWLEARSLEMIEAWIDDILDSPAHWGDSEDDLHEKFTHQFVNCGGPETVWAIPAFVDANDFLSKEHQKFLRHLIERLGSDRVRDLARV